MTGTKFGCGAALCGACTVHLDGQVIRSCVTPISAAGGKKITTIEAATDGSDRVGAAVHAAWTKHDVAQCGYCQSGQIMSATAFLKSRPLGKQPMAIGRRPRRAWMRERRAAGDRTSASTRACPVN
jgi:isoquinoline 1-oxidoreductase alpha subunit